MDRGGGGRERHQRQSAVVAHALVELIEQRLAQQSAALGLAQRQRQYPGRR